MGVFRFCFRRGARPGCPPLNSTPMVKLLAVCSVRVLEQMWKSSRDYIPVSLLFCFRRLSLRPTPEELREKHILLRK